MRKLVIFIASFIVAASTLSAQVTPFDYSGKFYMAFEGGLHYNLYENHFAYREHDSGKDLFTPQAGIVVGYDLNKIWGFRITGEYSKNAGAANTRESGDQFYPYTFKGVDFFADAVVNLYGIADNLGAFSPKVYGGIGYGHTFSFTDSGHPSQVIHGKNNAFGFRLGGILQYDFENGLGLYVDLRGEAFTDDYNGLKPGSADQPATGSAGFPLDLKAQVSFGVVYHLQ